MADPAAYLLPSLIPRPLHQSRLAQRAPKLGTQDKRVRSQTDRAQDAAAVQAAKAMSSATASTNGAMAQANKAVDQANKAADQAKNAANQVENTAQSAGNAASNLAGGQLPGALGTNAGASTGSGDAPLIKNPIGELKNPLGNLHERMSEACTKAKTPDENLICEVRVRAYQLTWHFRDDAMSVEGWQLVSPLRFGAGGDPSAPAVSLGSEESLKIGDAFVAKGPNGERLGYFKVVRVGPGGKAGESQPSELSLRLGDATEGMSLSEYHLWGLELSAYGSGEALVLNSAQHYVPLAMGVYATYAVQSAGCPALRRSVPIQPWVAATRALSAAARPGRTTASPTASPPSASTWASISRFERAPSGQGIWERLVPFVILEWRAMLAC